MTGAHIGIFVGDTSLAVSDVQQLEQTGTVTVQLRFQGATELTLYVHPDQVAKLYDLLQHVAGDLRHLMDTKAWRDLDAAYAQDEREIA